MATNTAGTNARELATQQTHYLRLRLNGTSGNGTFTIGIVPNGANILRITTLGRNSGGLTGGSATVSFGPSGTPAGFFAAAGGPVTTTGLTAVALIATATLAITADTTLVAVVAGTPTGGAVDVMVEYIPNIG
jgi:hypothetical protein